MNTLRWRKVISSRCGISRCDKCRSIAAIVFAYGLFALLRLHMSSKPEGITSRN